jgi:hypothetical protein
MNQSSIGRELFLSCLAAALMGCDGGNPDEPKPSAQKPDISAKPAVIGGPTTMQIYYLEIVTKEVDAATARWWTGGGAGTLARDGAAGGAAILVGK